jgi:hypothetical protein
MQNNSTILLKNPFRNGRVFCFLLLLAFQCTHSQSKIELNDAKKNFGFVKKGELVTLKYTFKNTGKDPLFIEDIKVQCSCTSFDYPKYPILPNNSDTIIIYFDTKMVYDRQDRIVEVYTNCKSPIQKLRFKGVVLKP